MLLIGFIVFYPPATSLVSRTLPITPQHLSVGVTLILSIFASLGFASMQTFLGRRDRFVTSLLIMMMLIALLDMWHVATGPLEFGLL